MNPLALPLLTMLLVVVAELAYIQWVKREPAPWAEMVFNLNSGHVLLWVFRGVELWVYALVYTHFSLDWVAGLSTWLVWILGFVAWDFGFYLLHYYHHKSRLLWAIHLVHHTGEDFNLSLGIRNSWYSSLSSIPFFWWMAVIGFTPTQFLVISVLHYSIQLYNHNSFYTKPTLLDTLFVTPYSHRIHHANAKPYLNKNFGSCLNLWDRLFGTYQRPVAAVAVQLGSHFPTTRNPYIANQWPWRQYWHLGWPNKPLLGPDPVLPMLVASAGVVLFLSVIYYVLFEQQWQLWQAVAWVGALTAATVLIGRYSDGHQRSAWWWCGLAVALAVWVALQGHGAWRWGLVGLLLAQVVFATGLLRRHQQTSGL